MSFCNSIVEAVKSPDTKATWRWVLASPLVIILCEYLAVAPMGAEIFKWLQFPFVFGLLAAVSAVFVLPFFLLLKRFRKKALAWWFLCLVFVPLGVFGVAIGPKIRMAAFDDLALRSKPLVEAIQKFSEKQGAPPKSLDDLVPDYLTEIPRTGMMAYPDYRYLVDEKANYYEGNPWVLEVSTSSGGINFDRFQYFPLQNYPTGRTKYSGSFEKIRDWAYFHE